MGCACPYMLSTFRPRKADKVVMREFLQKKLRGRHK